MEINRFYPVVQHPQPPSPAEAAQRKPEDETRQVASSDRTDEDGVQTRAAPGAERSGELDSREQREVEQLKRRDREVRTHEQAHLAAAGPLARGGPSYEYRVGPDGKRYAVGGEVQLDTSRERDPEQTLRKAERIRAAALAPVQPSGQDYRVASQASATAAEARVEIARRRSQQPDGTQAAASSRDAGVPGGPISQFTSVAEDTEQIAGVSLNDSA